MGFKEYSWNFKKLPSTIVSEDNFKLVLQLRVQEYTAIQGLESQFKKTSGTGNAPAPKCHTSMTLLASSQNSQKRIERWSRGQRPKSTSVPSNCRHGFTPRPKLQWILVSVGVTFQPLQVKKRKKRRWESLTIIATQRCLCLVFLSHTYILSGKLLLRGLKVCFVLFLIEIELIWVSLVAQTVKKIYLQCTKPRLDPCVGRILWRRKRHPTPVFLPGKFHGERSLMG